MEFELRNKEYKTKSDKFFIFEAKSFKDAVSRLERGEELQQPEPLG